MPADRTTADAQTPWAQGRGTPSSGPSSSATSASSPDSPDSALAGLDALQSDGRRRRSPGEVFRQRAAPTLAALVAAVLIWQLLVALIDPRPDIMPGPIDVARQVGAATADGTCSTISTGLALSCALSGRESRRMSLPGITCSSSPVRRCTSTNVDENARIVSAVHAMRRGRPCHSNAASVRTRRPAASV